MRRNAANPQAVIGSDITITGRIETKFGLVQLVPPGVGTTNQTAQEVNLADVATVNSTGNALPPAVTLDRTLSETQGINRTYYRSLQGMRVRLPEGIATGGGTTKFRDLFLEPGTTAQRLFRKNDAAAETTPWSRRAGRDRRVARRRRRQPGRPAPAVALADADRPRPVRHHAQRRRPADVQLQLLQGDAAAARAGLNDGEQPTIQRGPINAAAPPTAPGAAGQLDPRGDLQRREPVPGRQVQRRPCHHRSAEYDERVHAIVQAIRHRLREPDVVAVQEVAVFADGANALTGLAAALGNYTGYITTNNDGRGIATGFLVKNGTTATNGRLIGKDARSPWGSSTVCDLHPGPLFDRAPYALDLQKGDLSFTAMSNHWASQSHETHAAARRRRSTCATRTAELQQQGRNVLVAGDLNDFEFSTPLADADPGRPADEPVVRRAGGRGVLVQVQRPPADARPHRRHGRAEVAPASDFRYVHFDNDVYERTPDRRHRDLRPRPAAGDVPRGRREHEHAGRRLRQRARDAGADARPARRTSARSCPASPPTTRRR